MKVQTKIILLLSLMVMAFVTGLVVAKTFEKARFERVANARAEQRTKLFDEFLKRRGEPLATLAKDYSCWDWLVRALTTDDHDWATANLGDTPLTTYRANVIWVYRSDLSPFYSHNNLYADNLTELPLPRSAIPEIFAKEKLRHFFLKTPQGLMEIRAATIHPSQDGGRVTPPRGYFFAGQLWSNESVREMAFMTNNQIELVPAEKAPPQAAHQRVTLDSLAFSRDLRGYDGKPIAWLMVKNEMPEVAQITRFTNQLIIWVIVFALAVLGLLLLALVHWVSRPLRAIRETLNTEQAAPLAQLKNDRTEFGKIARLIEHFFEQRSALINEMNERRAAEKALQESEEQLRQAQKMEAVGQLAGGVAHDFNNLLTAIIGYSNLLVDKLDGDKTSKHAAEVIRRAGEQAASLTRQLLAFSRKQILQPRVIDLNTLVNEMESLLRRLIGEHIDLRTVIDAHDARVKADRGQIEQVILNLAVNARDAMPRGGVLTIRTANIFLDEKSSRVQAGLPIGDYVVIAVTDTGEGMNKETQERIFEPFFTTKGPGKGTGLGLATVYGVVKQSGGGISVESAPGRGTSFRIYLPLERAPLDLPKTPTVSAQPAKHAETILVVEDEDIVRKLVCNVLENLGYRVFCAARGTEAMRICTEQRGTIHLLITDVIMPEQSGPELAVRLLEMHPEMHVLYISGYSDVELSATVDGEIEILPKPFTPQQLAQRVDEILTNQPSELAYATADEH